jgi:hypothetical protein
MWDVHLVKIFDFNKIIILIIVIIMLFIITAILSVINSEVNLSTK